MDQVPRVEISDTSVTSAAPERGAGSEDEVSLAYLPYDSKVRIQSRYLPYD